MCSVTKSCLTLCDPVDCGPPGSSVHGISQARIQEWVAISSSRGSSRPRDRTCVSCIGRRTLPLSYQGSLGIGLECLLLGRRLLADAVEVTMIRNCPQEVMFFWERGRTRKATGRRRIGGSEKGREEARAGWLGYRVRGETASARPQGR